MASPRSAVGACPGGGLAAGVDQVKLAPLPLGVVAQKAGFHVVGAQVLFEPLQATDAQIGIGMGLGGHGSNPGADVRHGGPHR